MIKAPFLAAGIGLALLLGLNSGSRSNAAEEIPRTTRLVAMRYTSAGNLSGCGFAFNHVGPELVYERGLPVLLSGSISTFYSQSKSPGLLLNSLAIILTSSP